MSQRHELSKVVKFVLQRSYLYNILSYPPSMHTWLYTYAIQGLHISQRKPYHQMLKVTWIIAVESAATCTVDEWMSWSYLPTVPIALYVIFFSVVIHKPFSFKWVFDNLRVSLSGRMGLAGYNVIAFRSWWLEDNCV